MYRTPHTNQNQDFYSGTNPKPNPKVKKPLSNRMGEDAFKPMVKPKKERYQGLL